MPEENKNNQEKSNKQKYLRNWFAYSCCVIVRKIVTVMAFYGAFALTLRYFDILPRCDSELSISSILIVASLLLFFLFHRRNDFFTDLTLNNIKWRTIARLPWSSTFAGTTRHSLFAKRLQQRLFIRLVLIARYQSRRLVFQAFRRLLYQQLRVLFRAFAVDYLKHEFMFGIQRNMIPVIAATSISRIVCVAMLFLLCDETPLLVELNLFGVGGKSRRVRRGVFRRDRLRVGYNN